MSEEQRPSPHSGEEKSIVATDRSDGNRIQMLLTTTKSVPVDNIVGQRFGASGLHKNTV